MPPAAQSLFSHSVAGSFFRMNDSVLAGPQKTSSAMVSPPQREPHGQGWTACVRAEVNSATGQPMGMQTYRIFISGGQIIDRRRVETEDNCASEDYEPI